MYDSEEILKYKKKAKKRTPTKSKHKHSYEEVLIKGGSRNGGYMITTGKKCTICSKLVYGSFVMVPDEKSGLKKLLVDEKDIVDYYDSIGKTIDIVHVQSWGE